MSAAGGRQSTANLAKAAAIAKQEKEAIRRQSAEAATEVAKAAIALANGHADQANADARRANEAAVVAENKRIEAVARMEHEKAEKHKMLEEFANKLRNKQAETEGIVTDNEARRDSAVAREAQALE